MSVSFNIADRILKNEDIRNILLLIIAGFMIRFWGITYGLPAVYNSTEYFIAKHALSFGARQTLEPLFFIYPTLYGYFIALLFAGYFLAGLLFGWFQGAEDFAVQFMVDPAHFYLLGRLVNGVAIIAAAVILYRTLRYYLTPQLALIISFIFLFSINLHQFTFWMVPDAFLMLGTVIVLYYIVRLKEGNLSMGGMMFASLICGLTISVKYNAGFLALGWLLAVYLYVEGGWIPRLRKSLLALLAVFAGFFAGTPYWLITFSNFLNGFKMIASQASYAYNVESGIPYVWELVQFVKTDGLLGMLIIILMIFLLFRIGKSTLPFLAVVFPTFLYVGSWQKKGLDYLLVILPVLLVYASIEISKIARTEKSRKRLLGLLVLVLLFNVPRILYIDFLRSQPDTREQASLWIKSNLATGSAICYDHYHYDLHLIDIDRFTEYGEGSRFLSDNIKQKLEEFQNISGNYRFVSSQKKVVEPFLPDSLMTQAQEDPFLWQTYTNPHKTLEEIVDDGAQLLILNSDTYAKYLQNPPPPPQNPMRQDFLDRRNFYQHVFEWLSPIAVFKPGWTMSGPVIQVFLLGGN